jgi:predicted metal-dependent phosphoesterase TrpH
MLIDLHMHTRRSDGVWSVERLLEEVRARNLEVFTISDHDTLDAYPLPFDVPGQCIPGLEVDSHHGGHTVHLLAYGVTGKESPLLRALTAQRVARTGRMIAMIESVRTCGIDVTMDHVCAQAGDGANLGRPHLARALVALGAVGSVQEAFDRYLADDRSSYVALDRLTSAEIIGLIRASGGVSVVAHPQRLRTPEALDELLDLGVDGIEIVHPTADAETEARLIAKARERDVLITGGTDFHAPSPERVIGIDFPREDVERLLHAIAARSKQ